MPRIVTNLWFDTEAEPAAEFYCSVFPNSRVTGVTHYAEGGMGEPGTVMTMDFELDGVPFTGINGGPQFTFSEAISLLINCATQDEVDHYWKRLSDGGEEGPCGWLKDRYGLSWQVVPDGLEELMTDPAVAGAVMTCMRTMGKLDIAELRRAAEAAAGAARI